jgi:hypothetical protein
MAELVLKAKQFRESDVSSQENHQIIKTNAASNFLVATELPSVEESCTVI